MTSDMTNALSHIGTNAIPFLVKWVTYSPKPFPQDDDAACATWCAPVFSFLGTEALPPLLHLLDEQPSSTNDIAARVQGALACYHNDAAVPFYVSYITNTNAHYRPFVIHLLVLCPLATNTALALNTIIDCLTNRDAALVGAAKGALWMPPNFGAQTTYVPFLTNRLETSHDPMLRSNIMVVLGDMGLHWTFSPVITALEDRDRSVRIAATNAVQTWIRSVVQPSLKADLSRYLSRP